MVNGFQSVTNTHCLMSNLRHFIIIVFSMYFWQMYWVSFCLHMSRISTRSCLRQIPLPLELPAGFNIQIFLSPSRSNYGYYFLSSFITDTASAKSGYLEPISSIYYSFSLASSSSLDLSSCLSSSPYSSSSSYESS